MYSCRVGELASEVRVSLREESGGTEEYPGGLVRETQREHSSGASLHYYSVSFLISLLLSLITIK